MTNLLRRVDRGQTRGNWSGAGSAALAMPPETPVLGHLSQWTRDPLGLIERGARLGAPVFGLKLWRRAVVGSSPEWNRLVLGDVGGFRSRGSLSQLSPYLSAGVVAMDSPQHRHRRALLNPSFHRRAVTTTFADVFHDIAAARMPTGTFDAREWSSDLVRRMLTAAFLGPGFPEPVLKSFLAPLDRPMPGPLLRRPIRLRRMQRALAATLDDPPAGTLAETFAGLPDGIAEARVAIAAAYDTTAHTLAFALWELAARPDLDDAAMMSEVVSETLRLYPSGWIGSRVAAQDLVFEGVEIPAGRLVLYSPFLTHRDPDLWPRPTEFRPERFSEPLPAWGYIPFAAGERTCLGASLATLMLTTALASVAGGGLRRVSSSVRPQGGLTLAPDGAVLVHRAAPMRHLGAGRLP